MSTFNVKVNNVDENHCRYIVASVFETELWYWGSCDTYDQAVKLAENTNFTTGRRCVVVEDANA